MRVLMRRLPWMLATLLALSFLTFMLTSTLPGDPAEQILGIAAASPEALAQVREELGLDRPLLVRYVDWLRAAVSGDLGRSYVTRQPVLEAILERLPVTVQLAVMSIVMSLLLAIPVAMISAYNAGSWIDRTITSVTFGLMAVPGFMMALLLILLFAVSLGWLPAVGWASLGADPVQNLQSALLPAMTLAIAEFTLLLRVLRSDLIGTLQQDFITLARAKGLSRRRVLFGHALRPSSFSLLTVAGLRLGSIISGAIIVEEIFALPGVGRLLVQSIYQRDLMMVQGAVLFIAVSYVLVNFLVDLCYAYLDPRVRDGA